MMFTLKNYAGQDLDCVVHEVAQALMALRHLCATGEDLCPEEFEGIYNLMSTCGEVLKSVAPEIRGLIVKTHKMEKDHIQTAAQEFRRGRREGAERTWAAIERIVGLIDPPTVIHLRPAFEQVRAELETLS